MYETFSHSNAIVGSGMTNNGALSILPNSLYGGVSAIPTSSNAITLTTENSIAVNGKKICIDYSLDTEDSAQTTWKSTTISSSGYVTVALANSQGNKYIFVCVGSNRTNNAYSVFTAPISIYTHTSVYIHRIYLE